MCGRSHFYDRNYKLKKLMFLRHKYNWQTLATHDYLLLVTTVYFSLEHAADIFTLHI